MPRESPHPPEAHRVVIVGAGFGGLEATFRLAGAPDDVRDPCRMRLPACSGKRGGRKAAMRSDVGGIARLGTLVIRTLVVARSRWYVVLSPRLR